MPETLFLPVVISRWFHGGMNYAYNRNVDKTTLVDVVRALTPVTLRDVDHEFRHGVGPDRVLLGTRVADPDSPDPDAVGRNPYIIRAAVCDARLLPRHESALLEQIRNLPVPARPGESDTLIVRIEPPSAVPPVPVAMDHFARNLVVAAVVTLFVLDVAIHAAVPGGPLLPLLLRGAAALLLGLAAWKLLSATPTAEEAGLLEWEWYEDADLAHPRLMIAADAVIVAPDARPIRIASAATLSTLAIRRTKNTDIHYEIVTASRKCLTVAGREMLRWDGRSVLAAFVRSYERRGSGWALTFARWDV